MTHYLVDTSAWHRSMLPIVAQRWLELLDQDVLATCPQTRLEILYSARSATDYARLADELSGLHNIPSDAAAFARAESVQQQLSQVGGLHHRSVKIADLVIAASAELAGAIVLHYDEDFDRVAAITGQPVEWIAERGTL